jgi:CDP-diacylglycerol---glycerol-3-phosphate 3-phosphatidyltransferase
LIGSKIGHSLDPVVLRCYRFLFWNRHITPNTLTLIGLCFSIFAFVAIIIRLPLWVAGIILIISGFFDLLDGAVARTTNSVSRFGGFLDSVLDRYSDLLIMLGISIHFLYMNNTFFSVITFIAAIGVAIIPYARARAEAVSIECHNGLLERPERVILLVLGLVFCLLKPVILILAILTHITVIQRIMLTWSTAKKMKD